MKRNSRSLLLTKGECNPELLSTSEQSPPCVTIQPSLIKQEVQGDYLDCEQEKIVTFPICDALVQASNNNDSKVFEEEMGTIMNNEEILSSEPIPDEVKRRRKHSPVDRGYINFYSLENVKDSEEIHNIYSDIEITVDDVKIEKECQKGVKQGVKNVKEFKSCVVKGCPNSSICDDSIQFFVFPPHNTAICKRWLNYCNDESLFKLTPKQLVRLVICEKHFTEDSFESIVQKALKKNAVPIKSDESPAGDPTRLIVDLNTNLNGSTIKFKSHDLCSYLGCELRKTHYSVQFFWFPVHSHHLLFEWIINCGEKCLLVMAKSELGARVVCENHFTKDSFKKKFRKILKYNSVPNVPYEDGAPCKVSVPCEDGLDGQPHLDNPKMSSNNLQADLSNFLFFDDLSNPLFPPEESSESSKSTPHTVKVTEQNTSQQLPVLNDEDNVGQTSSDHFTSQVKAPVRTYKRTTSSLVKRRVPAIQSKAENGKSDLKKVININIKPLPPQKAEKLKEVSKTINYFRNIEDKKLSVLAEKLESGSPTASSINNSSLFEKYHSCYYCTELIFDMTDHLVEKHIDEEEVQIAFKHGTKKRENVLHFITRVGDFKHNCQVLKHNTGFIICLGGWCLSTLAVDKNQFFPCPICTAFIHVDSLKSHHKYCMLRIESKEETERNLFIKSRAMLGYLKKQEIMDVNNYFSLRLMSRFGFIAKNDEFLMLLVSYIFMQEKCLDAGLVLLTRLGFILLMYRKITKDEDIEFKDILRPKCVEPLIKALRCFFSQSKNSEIKNLYASLYSHISISAFVWRGKCLMDGKLKSAREALYFFSSFTKDYEKEVKVVLNQANLSAEPSKTASSLDPADILQFKNTLNERIVQLTNALNGRVISKETVKVLWNDLAEATMTYLCLINPVDFVVIEQLSFIEYAVRPDKAIQDITKYTKTILPTFKCLEKYSFFITEYINSEIVILLSLAVKEAIDTLIKKRIEVGIPSLHPKLFSGCIDTKNLSAMSSFYSVCKSNKEGFCGEVLGSLKKRRMISYIIHFSEMDLEEVQSFREYIKSRDEDKSMEQIPLEFNHLSEIKDELKEAFSIFEDSQ